MQEVLPVEAPVLIELPLYRQDGKRGHGGRQGKDCRTVPERMFAGGSRMLCITYN